MISSTMLGLTIIQQTGFLLMLQGTPLELLLTLVFGLYNIHRDAHNCVRVCILILFFLFRQYYILVNLTNNETSGKLLFCRNIGNNTYNATTWRIIFSLESVDNTSNYTLQLALAAAQRAELQVCSLSLIP